MPRLSPDGADARVPARAIRTGVAGASATQGPPNPHRPVVRRTLLADCGEAFGATDFAGLTGLTSLRLTGATGYYKQAASVEHIELPAGVFDPLSNLEQLYLDGDRFSSLPSGVFDQLSSLLVLSFHGNQFSSLPSGIFDQLSSLLVLDLERQQFASLSSGIFDQLSSLLGLYIQSSQLNSLPNGVFDQLPILLSLKLGTNQLSSLPSGVFDQLPSLQRLHLGNNQLGSLRNGLFDQLSKLRWLWLTSNQLTALPDGVFNQLTELEDLYLNDNQLTELQDGVFDNLSRLWKLSLGGNSFTSPPVNVHLIYDASDHSVVAWMPAAAPAPTTVTITASNAAPAASTVTVEAGRSVSERIVLTPTGSGSSSISLSHTARLRGNFSHDGFDVAVGEIIANSTPTFGEQTVSSQPFRSDMPISPFTLPAATGGNGRLRYSLADADGALPAGLAFDAQTRTLSGTPTAAGEYAMTYRVTDIDGSSAALRFAITIVAPLAIPVQ